MQTSVELLVLRLYRCKEIQQDLHSRLDTGLINCRKTLTMVTFDGGWLRTAGLSSF